jgi:hypothetical protein
LRSRGGKKFYGGAQHVWILCMELAPCHRPGA